MPRVLSICLVLVPCPLRAQALVVRLPSALQILTSGTADLELRPDRATLLNHGGNQRRSAIAGAATARQQREVRDSIRVIGVAIDPMSTASIEIHRRFLSRGEIKLPHISGSVAPNSVRVEIRIVDQSGAHHQFRVDQRGNGYWKATIHFFGFGGRSSTRVWPYDNEGYVRSRCHPSRLGVPLAEPSNFLLSRATSVLWRWAGCSRCV